RRRGDRGGRGRRASRGFAAARRRGGERGGGERGAEVHAHRAPGRYFESWTQRPSESSGESALPASSTHSKEINGVPPPPPSGGCFGNSIDCPAGRITRSTTTSLFATWVHFALFVKTSLALRPPSAIAPSSVISGPGLFEHDPEASISSPALTISLKR